MLAVLGLISWLLPPNARQSDPLCGGAGCGRCVLLLCRTLSSLVLSAEVPAVGVFCFCCRTLSSLILSAEAPSVGDAFCFCRQSLGSLILSAEAPAVGDAFCFCRQSLGSLILSTEAPAVGDAFCFCRKRWAVVSSLPRRRLWAFSNYVG